MLDSVTHLATLDTQPPFHLEVLSSEGVTSCHLDALLALLPKSLLALSTSLQQLDAFSEKKESLESSQWQIDLTLTDDATMSALNQAHRDKSTSTDVLSFPMVHHFTAQFLSESLPPYMQHTPIHLGSIVVSLTWAETHWTEENDRHSCLESYLVERICHGCLHVMGLHHDTPDDYNQVVAIQTSVINAVFKP